MDFYIYTIQYRRARAYATRCVLGVTSLFSLIVLGLAANWISMTQQHINLYYAYAALAVATAVLTFTVPVMYAADRLDPRYINAETLP